MAVTADQVVVKLVAETAQYQRGMQSAASAAVTFDLKASTAIGNFGKDLVNFGNTSVKTTQQVNTSLRAMADETARSSVRAEQSLDKLIRKQIEFGNSTGRVVPGNLPGLGGAPYNGGRPIIAMQPDPFVAPRKGFIGLTGALNAGRHQIQNTSYQLQDIAVQMAAGTAASVALGQQLPQLLGGFGAMGAVLGVVVAVGVPLAAMLLRNNEEAIDLTKSVSALRDALEALRDAQQNAALPVDVLIEKYGALGDEMARVFQNQLAIARQELDALAKAISAAIAETADLDNMVTRFDALKQAVDAGVITNEEYLATLKNLTEQFGFTVAQALQYENLMERAADAKGPEAQAAAWLEVYDWISANRTALEDQGVAVDDLLRQTNDLAEGYATAHEAASDITAAADAGAIATDSWAAAAANLAAEMENAAGAAGRAAAAVGAAIAAQNAAAGAQLGSLGGLDVFSASSGRALTAGNGGTSAADQTAFDIAWRERVKKEEEAVRKAVASGGRSAGGRKSSGGGGRASAAKEPANIFEDAAADLQALERQITLIGKGTEETAKLRAQWELLDAAKKAGIPINDALNSQIDAQAAQVGRLTAELERGEIAQQEFDDGVKGIATAFSNAILEGESFRDSMAQIFKQIAANILNAGIQNAITSAFSGASGGGFLGKVLGAAFGGTKAATPSFDGGGYTGMGARAGGIDGKGGFPAILHPNETVVDHTKGQTGGMAYSPTFNIGGNVTPADLAAVRREAAMGFAQMRDQVPSIMSDYQKRN